MKTPKRKTNFANAPYACDPAKSRGRAFAASSSPTRSQYQRDRDRIIHSTAFRRLQHKTQVFLHHEGQHYRTRLTHTLEVSQITRSMARALNLNEDLAEAIALAHDLGHTPFGHAGERALNKSMQNWGGFDHNLQALRTLCVLENRYADHDGMNLTWETLEGTLKHNGPVTNSPNLSFLPEGFDLEATTFASLEAQVAAIADDIAYDAHDIDDAIRAGLIELDQLLELPLLGPIVGEVTSRWPDIDKDRQTHEVQRRLITQLIEDAIGSSLQNLIEVAPRSPSDVRQAGRTLVTFSKKMAQAEHEIKEFLFANVYRAPAVMTPVLASQKVVEGLFNAYMGESRLPFEWQRKIDAQNSNRAKARIICDYIAGMTDPFAIAEYQRLFDASFELS
ncbi:MAG TPA: deoxyguanosinetriphosphate triphosphohydrolase [Devosia sp.]|nr:deoxyguanosinetriphosphate triphosphohydrolase [Devosia sp.]